MSLKINKSQVFLIVIIFLATVFIVRKHVSSATKTKIYITNEKYERKINSFSTLNINLPVGEIRKSKVNSHINNINMKNSEFRLFSKKVSGVEFESITLKNNHFIIISKNPNLVLNAYCLYLNKKSLARLRDRINFCKEEKVVEMLMNDSIYLCNTLENLHMITIAARSCFN